MKIETKFNIGDAVLFILNAIVVSRKVKGIDICFYGPDDFCIYYNLDKINDKVNELQVFKTKQELLDSL